MPRKPHPRREHPLTPPERAEIVTYLMNADEIATMSSHFVMQVTSQQLRRAGVMETKREGFEKTSAATGSFWRE